VATLSLLFGLLLDLDEAGSAERSTEPSVRQELRRCVLRQLLVWATFADQLAALREADRCLLDRVHRHLLVQLSRQDEEGASAWPAEDAALCWQVLLVGWDHFCRSTHQQLDVLALALRQSATDADSLHTAEVAAAQNSVAASSPQARLSPSPDSAAPAHPAPHPSLYTLLLAEPSALAPSSGGLNTSGRTGPLPLELFLARFINRHPSFYELELLNKSVVKSYLVALDARVY